MANKTHKGIAPKTIHVTGINNRKGRYQVLINDTPKELTMTSFLYMVAMVAARLGLYGQDGSVNVRDLSPTSNNTARYMYRMRRQCGMEYHLYVSDWQGNYRLPDGVKVSIDVDALAGVDDYRVWLMVGGKERMAKEEGVR